MMGKINLHSHEFAKDYKTWNSYYNYMLVSFYVTRISKQCARFNQSFPDNMVFLALCTNKFVETKEPTRATMGRNFTDTRFVEDTYYNTAKYIYEHRSESFEDKMAIKQYLKNESRCIPKSWALSYVVEAIETSDLETFKKCLHKIKSLPWHQAMSANNSQHDAYCLWNDPLNPNWKWPTEDKYKPFDWHGVDL